MCPLFDGADLSSGVVQVRFVTLCEVVDECYFETLCKGYDASPLAGWGHASRGGGEAYEEVVLRRCWIRGGLVVIDGHDGEYTYERASDLVSVFVSRAVKSLGRRLLFVVVVVSACKSRRDTDAHLRDTYSQRIEDSHSQ